MKKIYCTVCLLVVLCMASACGDFFLDKMPDRRTELDSNQKIRDLLVSAYPTSDPMMIYEHRTDNVMDNGKKYGSEMITLFENYHWKDISDTGSDSPEGLWRGCYGAIAAANQALGAIQRIGSSKENNSAKGEALICRAYAHFLLANTFCMPYVEATAKTDMGIPYVEEPETFVGKKYERGTVESVYEKLARDIEEGFPLIDDNAYSVPIYHFTRRAAAAFACRFYLFYGKYEQALQYADMAIDDDPSASLRDMISYSVLVSRKDIHHKFISKDEPANLLLVALYSLWGRNYGARNERYGNSIEMVRRTLYQSPGPWGRVLPGFDKLFGSGVSVDQPKYDLIFESTNVQAGIGFAHVVQMAFTVDETLLCRAEAKVMLKRYDEAARDLSLYYVKKGGKAASATEIVEYYTKRRDADQKEFEGGTLAPWLMLVKPFNAPFVIESGTQEMMLQAVLHVRRIEDIWGGLRWLHLRRFGIEVEHNIDEDNSIKLSATDLRRVIQLPKSVISAGLPANPR